MCPIKKMVTGPTLSTRRGAREGLGRGCKEKELGENRKSGDARK